MQRNIEAMRKMSQAQILLELLENENSKATVLPWLNAFSSSMLCSIINN